MVTELASGVWWVETGRVPYLRGNGYLVDDDGTLTLVDAGLPWNAAQVRAGVEAAGHAVRDVERVLVTHYDLDHFGALARLSDLDAPIYVGQFDADLATGECSPPWLHHKGAFHRLLRLGFRFPERLPLHRVADGDRIGGFTAYHTPGHNPGHTVYVHEKLSVGLLGDLVWEEDGTLRPPVWLDSYDMGTLRRSIRSFAARTPRFEVACVGHGRPLDHDGWRAIRALAETLNERAVLHN